jgi:hypothetical protein
MRETEGERKEEWRQIEEAHSVSPRSLNRGTADLDKNDFNDMKVA